LLDVAAYATQRAHHSRGVRAPHSKHCDVGVAAANALVPGGFTGFADWSRVNMKPS
jgi:hypothetical protein